MSLYNRLYCAYTNCYKSELSKSAIQEKTNECRNELKNQCSNNQVLLEKKTFEKTEEVKQLSTKKTGKLLSFFTKTPSKRPDEAAKATETVHVAQGEGSVSLEDVQMVSDARLNEGDFPPHKGQQEADPIVCSAEEQANVDDPSPSISSKQSFPKLRQEALQKEISILEVELNCMVMKRDAGFEVEGMNTAIKRMRTELEAKKKALKTTQKRAAGQKKFREKRRSQLKKLSEQHPEAAKIISIKREGGRPQLEEDQPGLLQAICDIAMHSGSAADRRRTEIIRACKTLDDLHTELVRLGYNLSRTATYLRLIPRNCVTIEGKRHVETVPVKLCRAQADHHRDHPDHFFCKATINGLEELPSILGHQQVAFISQDDKAKVPLGMTAAKEQAPILMHLDYKIQLPDHDWMVASRHKLTPSFYAGIKIKENCMGMKEAVTHSGPTYIGIRSGEHSSSTASTHAKDLDRILILRSSSSS